MTAHSFTICLVLLLLVNVRSFGQDKQPWWNPFAGSSTTSSSDAGVRESSFFNGGSKSAKAKESSWTLPKMPWSADSKPNTRQGPSTFSRMGKSTKKMWNSTVDFINPFDSPKSPTTQGYQPQYAEKSSSGGGPLGWLWREEKVESPTTVNDFLRQPRPKF